jgi:FkbM family methyltransferase
MKKIIYKLEKIVKDSIKNVSIKLGYKISRIQNIKISSRIVKTKIGKFYLYMREDHMLPTLLKYQTYYSTNLPRLAVELFKKYPDLKMIDVGANIGDTVALTRSQCSFPITCIEGDDDFFSLLEKNTKQFKDVRIFKQLLGDKNENVITKFKKNIETARIHNNQSTVSDRTTLSVITLDHFLENHTDIGQSKLLKIDTDGYDMKILRGGLEYIENTRPVIFAEYDTVFFAEHGEIGTTTLLTLENLGYDDIIYYNNLGKLIISSSLSNHLLVKQMDDYIDMKQRTPFPYYDIVLFHKDDKDIAKQFIEKEMLFFYGNK